MMKKYIFLSAIFTSLVIGQSYVLNFDGTNDYLSVPATDNASTQLDGQFTVSAWVFIEGDDRQQIFYNDGFEVEWLGTAYNSFRLQPGGVPSVSNLHRFQWHHVVMTRNSSSSIQIYVNGDLSRSYVSSSSTFDDVLYIGQDPDDGQYFDGSMDELAIWNTELSASQVDSLYNKGVPESATGILGAASSLKSYWKLEESSGSTAPNSVASGAALTLNNSPTWKKFTHSDVPQRMANIRSYSNSSYPENFIEFNNKIYFKADGGSYGYEMWEYDPSADSSSTNPQRISDIRSGSSAGISWTDHWIVYNGALYFVGNDGSYGDELYSYDGSSFTRISDIYSGSNSSSPNYLTVFNDKLYFSAYNSSYGTELYVYDGTSVDTVSDYASGSTSGFGWGGMAVFNNKLYYQGYSSTTGYELYSYDGTDIALAADIKSGSDNNGWINSSYPKDFTVFGDKLFFSAEDATIGGELFYYDGSTTTGIDIYSGSSTSGDPNSSWPYSSAVFNDTLYFRANDGTNGDELWGYDTATGARLIKDIAPGTYTSGSSTYQNSSSPYELTVFNNKLYFSATDGYNVTGTAGQELWYYDGNDAGRVADIRAGSNGSSPYNLFATTDKLYFSAADASSGTEPYFLSAGDPFPSITSVTSTTSDGTYKLGDEINITVNFSEAVTLSSGGTMTITLETGTTDQTVSITSITITIIISIITIITTIITIIIITIITITTIITIIITIITTPTPGIRHTPGPGDTQPSPPTQ